MDPSATENFDRRFLAIAWGLIVPPIIAAALFWLVPTALAEDPVDKCDVAIQSGLAAPATYERISASASGSGDRYLVTYESQNAFGVPLRKWGECDLSVYPAKWIEFPL